MPDLFDTSDFVPRWVCGNWSAGLGWLFVASDLLIWLAYLGIPVALVYVARRRPDLPFRRLFVMFGLFIVSCGATHLLDAAMFWWPAYRLGAVARVATAVASWGTLAFLLPALPRVLRLRNPEDLEREVAERRKAEDALRRANDELAARVAERTAELERANADLRRTAGLLLAVAEQTPDAVSVKDRDGRFLLLNPAAAKFLGRPAGELIGRDLAAALDPAGAARVMARDRRVMETGRAETAEEVLTAGGVTRAYLATKAPYRDADGAVIGVIGVSQDVTDRRAAADALGRSEKRYRSLVRATSQIVWTAGPRGGLTSVDGGEAFVPDPAARLSGPAWDAITHPDDRERVATAWAAALAGGEPFGVEYRLRRADGEWREVAVRAVPVPGEAGGVDEWVGVTDDVTDRLRLEDQLRQAQKMEAVGQLAGGVAHDFNNLLTVINGYSELLLETVRRGDPARPLVEEIRRAGDRSAALTRQLLAFSRREVVAPRVLDPNAVVRDLEGMLRRVIGEDIRLELALAADAGPVLADRGQLDQVLLNLVVNARDAMPTGGTLAVATGTTEVAGRPPPGAPAVRPGRYAVLTVRDTGCGMTAEVRARIFDPFFTTKGVGKGTGLGLSVVHGVAARAGGGVGVESAPGRGTAFHVYLPRVEAPVPTPKPRSVLVEAPRGTETVLLVEDEAAVRALARAVLEAAGYTVVEAVDGGDVDRALADHRGPVDLLVTDVVMPGAGGGEVAARLRADHPGLRVLFVSGYTDDAVVRHGVEREGVDFLQKPFTPVVLAHAVRAVLDRPAAVGEPSMAAG